MVNTPVETIAVTAARIQMGLTTRAGCLPAAIDPAWILPGRIIPLMRNIRLRGVLRGFGLAAAADLRSGELLLAPLAG